MDLKIPEEIVLNKIFFIRGQKVMPAWLRLADRLDEDLAQLYDVETRRLNEQVKRNPERFPEDFAFQLTSNEFENLMSQNATSSWGGRRKLPYAFTELGIAMLSSVLKSQKAIQANIAIMRVFTYARQ